MSEYLDKPLRPLVELAARQAVECWLAFDPVTMRGHGALQGAMDALRYAVSLAERRSTEVQS